MSRKELGKPIKVSNPSTFFGNSKSKTAVSTKNIITPTHVVSGHAPGMVKGKDGVWRMPELPIFGGSSVILPPAPRKPIAEPTNTRVDHPSNWGQKPIFIKDHAPGMVKGKEGVWHMPELPIFSTNIITKPTNTRVDHPSNWGQKPIFVKPIKDSPRPIDYLQDFKPINPLLKDELSFDNGITVGDTYYPDQPPIGFKQIIDHAKPNDGNTGINYKITIKGKVIDDTNQPMPYVEVFEENNPSNGTITDNNGNYSLQVWALGNTVFSFASYKQTFVATSIPPILKLMPNTLDTVNLGTVNKPKMSLAGFGLVGIALLALALGGGVKNAKPQTKKATGLNKPIRKKTKTVIL